MKMLLILAASAALVHAGCITARTSRITAGDLAEAVPLFHSLDPAAPVGSTPLPGVQRIFTRHQLLLILERYGLGDQSDTAIPDVCVERWAVPIASSQMKDALIAALGIADADIDLIDFSRQPLPRGALEFRRQDLTRPPETAPDAPVIWRGRLHYDEQRSAAVWAKVRISVARTYFVAAEDIPAGARIRAGQVRAVAGRNFPDRGMSPSSAEMIIGKMARRSIPSGQRFLSGMLDDPPEVQRGERVHVQVLEGQARLSLDAVAPSAARKGDTILLHNPLNGRNFPAVVTARDEAVVKSTGSK